MEQEEDFLLQAIQLASEHSKDGNHGPFGAVIVKDGNVIARGWNQVVASRDPSAHAEVVAIRAACDALNSHELAGCTLYSSCEPCPMCFGAAIWSRVDRIVFAETRYGAANVGFDDEIIYRAINQGKTQQVIPCEHRPMREATAVFEQWALNENKKEY